MVHDNIVLVARVIGNDMTLAADENTSENGSHGLTQEIEVEPRTFPNDSA